MIIMGIDPGSRLMGYGLIHKKGNRSLHIDNGAIDSRKLKTFNERLLFVYQETKKLVQKFKPDVVSIENVFYAKNVQTAIKLGHARGVALVAAMDHDCDLFEYSPLEIKQAVVGYGKATKDQVQMMVKRLLNLPEIAEENASDALAVALCHAHSSALTHIQERAL